MVEAVLLGIVSTVVGLWLGSIEWRFRGMDARMRHAPDREEVERTIDMKQEAQDVMQENLREDIKELKVKLDKLLEMQLRKQ